MLQRPGGTPPRQECLAGYGKFWRRRGIRAAICEQATKTIPTGAVHDQFDLPVIMACYVIRHGTNLDDLVELTAPNFGPDRVEVEKALAMCEGASKTVPGPLTVRVPGDHMWEVFVIRDELDPILDVTLETRNFGRAEVVVGPTLAICEEAKNAIPGACPSWLGCIDHNFTCPGLDAAQ